MPRAVASLRPSEPPRLIGLPVTTPGTVYPACIEYVSIIQAMIWALVLTSGAGMSFSGPTRTSISVKNRRVSASSSFWLRLLRIDDHATLAAAVRDADHRALPGHPHREGLDLVERHVLVIADAALGRAAAEVVLDAVAGEHLDRSVVHVDREVDGELAAWLAQDEAHAWIEVEALGGEVELALGDFPRVDRERPARWSWKERPPCRAAVGGRLVGVGRLPDDPTGRIDRTRRSIGLVRDARLMCDAEYSRRCAP